MINFAIIGSGQMAEIYASLLGERSDCRVVAVAGNTERKTADFAQRFGVEPYSSRDLKALYRDHPEITASVIATPEWVRTEPLRMAIDHRQHILLEKPFATNSADAATFFSWLDGYDRVFGICHVLRYSSRFAAMKKAIDDGRIGEVRHIFARRNSNRRRVHRVLGRTDLAYWLAPHDIDMIRWITGSEIVEAFARSRAGLTQEDDYLIAQLRCANGVDAVFECSWCAPPLSGTAREAVFEVRGTAGSIELEDFDMNVRIFSADERVNAPDTYEYFEVHGATRGMFEPMIDRFVRRVRSNEIDPNAARDAYANARVSDLIRRSLDTGEIARDA